MTENDRLIFRVSSYALLAVSTLLALTVPMNDTHQSVPVTLALAGAAALWLLWTVRGLPRQRVLYYVVLLALIVALVWANSWYSVFGAIGFGQALGLLPPRWIAVGFGAQTALTVLVQGPDSPSWVVLVNVMVPMVWAGVAVGRQTEKHQRTSEELAAALAENTGLHEQLLVQAREAGVLDERQRMAREIHDTLAQGLAGIITQLQAAEQTGDRSHVERATRLARESLTQARRSVQALRPEPLEGNRLVDAVAELAQGWSRDSGVPATMSTEGEPRPVTPDREVALFRVAQEALANIAKHAKASRVGVTLSYLDDQVVLDVRDDGRGFVSDRDDASGATAAAAGPSGGFGLTIMRQRLDGVGGALAVESEPGGGTAISASVPGE
ncbi:sensor histidine kinase [Kutzneria sp. NPDC051319]|uniref:sensor histidine kinase n=1 Tax=Kutzneria sp. NPDC051319 TaxID=3155047 RepID=UPI00341DF190